MLICGFIIFFFTDATSPTKEEQKTKKVPEQASFKSSTVPPSASNICNICCAYFSLLPQAQACSFWRGTSKGCSALPDIFVSWSVERFTPVKRQSLSPQNSLSFTSDKGFYSNLWLTGSSFYRNQFTGSGPCKVACTFSRPRWSIPPRKLPSASKKWMWKLP